MRVSGKRKEASEGLSIVDGGEGGFLIKLFLTINSITYDI